MRWSYLFGLFCGLAKVHLVSVHAAFRVSDLPKYAMSGVRFHNCRKSIVNCLV